MPTKKESHAKRASISLTPRFHRRGTPAPPAFPTTQKNETNPIPPSQPPTAKKCETNPICPHGHPDYAKRTQSTVPARDPKIRNKPNLPLHARPTTKMRKTNPIPVPLASPRHYDPQKMRNQPNPRLEPPNLQSTIYNLQSLPSPNMRNEPNSRISSVPPPPVSAKQTQFTPPPPSPQPKYAKRTQFRPANSQQPTTKKYETNPISSPLVPHAYSLVPRFHETNPISGPKNEILRTKDYMLKTAFNKTNPIYRTIYNPQYTIYNPLAQSHTTRLIPA